MATQNYNINVNTTQAVGSMQKLQSSTDRIRGAFSGLGTAIGALAFGSVIRNAVGFAAAVNDMSSATNVSRESILGLGQALTTNGGQASKATDAVQKFSLSLGQAAEGSRSTQAAFASVGISLDDLSRLDESEILARTIEGLGNITDAGRRAAVQAQIFGKTMAGVNAAGLASNFRNLAIEQGRNADAIRRAGEAQDKLNAAMNRFQVAVIKTIQPMVDAFNRLSDEQIEKFIESLVKVGAAAVSFVALTKTVQAMGAAFSTLGTVMAFLGTTALALFGLFKAGLLNIKFGFGVAFDAVRSFLMTIKQLVSVFTKFSIPAALKATTYTALTVEIGKTLTMLAKRWGFAKAAALVFAGAAVVVGAGLAKVAAVVGVVSAALYGLNAVFKAAFDTDPLDIMLKKLRQVGQAIGLVKPTAEVTGLNTGSGPRGSIGTGRAAEEKRLAQVREINDALDGQRKNIRAVTQAFADQNRQIADNIVKEAGYINLSSEQVEVLRAQDEVYARAAASVKELQDRKANLARDEAGLIPVIDQQIAAIQARARADSEMIAASVQALQSQQLLEQDRVNNIERITAAIERQQTVADELNRIRKDGNQAIADATAEAAMAAMNPLERQREQIVRANEATARAAGAAFAAQFEGMELTARQAQELADGLDLIAEKYNKVTEIQLGNLEASRTWADGWRSAFDDYVDAATNAASQARSVFSVATKGMEDMFVNFARTGKLNVKDLFKTIVETILRSQVQQLLARTLSGGGGGGGSILGTLFGAITGARSAGGPVSAGRAYRVGESGPETFVPTGGGSIVPGGGATSVTYNITATDAASFQALIARDPEFLFAVTEQGRKRMPNNRR